MLEEKADTSKWEAQNRFSEFGRTHGFVVGKWGLLDVGNNGSLEK